MRRFLAALLAGVCMACAAQAADNPPESKLGDKMKAAAKSESAQNVKAQGLAKIGMDITPAPPNAQVYLIEPRDAATVQSPFKVVFGLAGMGVAPAGTQSPNTGHHHLLIDNPEVDLNAPLPKSEQILHFGGGQTETLLELKPGKHTLQLVLGDWKHQPHHPPLLSEKITITVK